MNSKAFDKQDLMQAAHEIGLSISQAEDLWQSLYRKNLKNQNSEVKPTSPNRFDLLNVIYYFGALVICIALGWFMEKSYAVYGARALLFISLSYAIFFYGTGFYFWKVKKQQILGGLGIFLGLLMVPIAAYAFQEVMGWWTGNNPVEFTSLYSWIQGGWFFIEVSTILLTLLTLYFIRFPFLTAILYFSLWCMIMNAASAVDTRINHVSFWNGYRIASIAFGVVLVAAMILRDRKKGEDFAFWGYSIGVLSFWGAITSFHYESELGNLGYCFVNVFLVILAPILRRKVFLIFGILGVLIYFGELILRHFSDSALFPFILTVIGLLVIAIAVTLQANKNRIRSFLRHLKIRSSTKYKAES